MMSSGEIDNEGKLVEPKTLARFNFTLNTHH